MEEIFSWIALLSKLMNFDIHKLNLQPHDLQEKVFEQWASIFHHWQSTPAAKHISYLIQHFYLILPVMRDYGTANFTCNSGGHTFNTAT